MTTYAIGDIQGCYDGLARLLERLRFDPAVDRLWFVGDLVNRGGQSLEVLRLVSELGSAATVVLGNHDLALLARAEQPAAERRSNTELDLVLDAPDAAELLGWLRRRPLLHVDRALGWSLAHAGIHPTWDLAEAERYAREVEPIIRSGQVRSLFGQPAGAWSTACSRRDRLLFITTSFTRMRFLTADGAHAAGENGPPGSQAPGLVPWFAWERRRALETGVVWGHWAALGLHRGEGLLAIDTGYVWGGALTAARLDPPGEFVQVPGTRTGPATARGPEAH